MQFQILGSAWSSANQVIQQMRDGVEPDKTEEISTVLTTHLPEIREIFTTKAGWVGHILHAEKTIFVDPWMNIEQAH
jgi:divalent metal cation (Fe/Co/Zn/Cd) transporter